MAGCVPVGVFGSFATPLIKTASDGCVWVVLGKYFAGAVSGSGVGVAIGYGIYRLYYHFYPVKEAKSEVQEFFISDSKKNR